MYECKHFHKARLVTPLSQNLILEDIAALELKDTTALELERRIETIRFIVFEHCSVSLLLTSHKYNTHNLLQFSDRGLVS